MKIIKAKPRLLIVYEMEKAWLLVNDRSPVRPGGFPYM